MTESKQQKPRDDSNIFLKSVYKYIDLTCCCLNQL